MPLQFSRSILDEAAYESCKWKVLDVIPQEFISVLSYYAKLRDIDFTAEKGTLFALCGKHMTFQTPNQLLLRPIPTEEAFHKFNQYSSYGLEGNSYKSQVD